MAVGDAETTISAAAWIHTWGSDVEGALSVAAARYDEDAEVFRQVSKTLRAGGPPPAMFAPGEAGARAADRLAEQFTHQAKAARGALVALSSVDEVA